ncbi:hypothetical protein DUNSADRAFT_4473 [Dunaliella salina]|uniref:CHASE domain-containing protein n=1 Tax=Dunaliella salina TaxID=3046 RepID=A0ABQ7GRY3_DUNSA|nr:hypothetical protein DUNSADRAFT_4473 [Dunaliella salina]|eukprot:KAF5837368.1 hypothetical protein DUNSADRAFT_4473 [Dunaliella salina]
MAAVVKMNPSWSFLEAVFLPLAKELFRQSGPGPSKLGRNLDIKEIGLLPFGRVRAIYGVPVSRNTSRDLFSPELVTLLGPYRSMRERGLTVNGPIPLSDGVRGFAARYPVFFPDTNEDENWGHPDNVTHPTGCPGPPCYNPETREKFWGFIGAVVNAEPILAGKNVHLERLLSDDLSYSLTTSFLAGESGPGTIVSGGPNPSRVTANVTVELPGTSWALSVHNPRQDQIVNLRVGLLVMVVAAALILSALLLLLQLSAKRASVLLEEQLATNKLLQEEKVSRETLLGRQLDLIACFDRSIHFKKKRSKSKLADREMNTLGE